MHWRSSGGRGGYAVFIAGITEAKGGVSVPALWRAPRLPNPAATQGDIGRTGGILILSRKEPHFKNPIRINGTSRACLEALSKINEHTDGIVVGHPECPMETVALADANGSTQYIRNFVKEQPAGASIAIGTEINMVARLAQEHPDKHIECLDEEICPCSTMYMIHPAYLMDVLERLVDGEIPNLIVVSDDVQTGSLLALNRMLAILK